jgi:nucleoside-diphosphate-sugar epimerase
MALPNAPIFVTGASGFIGGHVVQRLAKRGCTVWASGRNHDALERLSAPNVRLFPLDLATNALPALDGVRAIIHCAALSAPWADTDAFWQANVVATERLLHAAQKAAVPRFIHIGSPSIYFRFADQIGLSEDFIPPENWITPYARSKWISEERVRAANIPAIILRPRAVFGEGDSAIFPRILKVAARGWFPLIHGGKAVIDICYVANLVDAIEAALEAQTMTPAASYNITNGEPIVVRELLQQVFSALDMRVRLLPVPRALALPLAGISERIARMRKGQPEPRLTRYGVGVIGYSQTLAINRAQNDLQYRPNISIAEGIERFARWWQAYA